MNKWLKRSLIGIGGVVVCVGAAAALGGWLADRKMNRRVEMPPIERVALPESPAALDRGKYLFLTRGCTECHGSNGGGRLFVNDGSMKLAGPNITPGGAVVERYRTDDWVRTIRHGVKPDGKPVFVMPSEDYNRLSDEDVGALIAYLLTLPPQPGADGIKQVPLPVRALYGFGAIQDAAEKIDHSLPPASPVHALEVNERLGAYVANMCIGCHGEKLSGGKIPGGPPDWPAAANLTPGEGGSMARYADATAFITMLRSGKRPDGTPIQVMPFGSLKELNDTEAQSLYAYLKTLPARKAGGR